MTKPTRNTSSAGPPVRKTLHATTAETDDNQLQTFSFEVSAGRQSAVSSEPISARKGLRTARVATVRAAPPRATIAVPQGQVAGANQRLPRHRWRRRPLPAWAVSLLAHAALLALLALLSFSTIHERFDFSLSFDADPWEEETELELVSFDSLDDLDSLADPSPVPEVEPLPLSPVSETQLADAIAPPAAPALLTPTMGLGGGLLQLGTESVADALPKEQPLTATFFGTEVEGNRIVYVVDNSGGMRGGELEALAEELLRSVESLRPDQRFYVIFYSDMLYPLFYPRPVDHFVQADDRTKQRLRQWLAGVEFCLGNVVDEAVAAAASIRPDVVYLLTDGDLDSTRDQRRMGYLLNTRGRRFKIHTFGMGTGNSGKAAEKLKMVAEKNRGKFHPVEVTVEFKQRAEATNRPYHNKEPGRVWGLSVGGGWGR